MSQKTEKLVIGHRNPDTDSVASAYALAQLKQLLGENGVSAACAGLPSERTEYLFKRFNVPLPPVRRDVYPRVSDIISNTLPALTCGETLFEALKKLQQYHVTRLPVVDTDNHYCGMLCLYSILGDMLKVSDESEDVGVSSLTGRGVYSSLSLIRNVVEGDAISWEDETSEQHFEVYVAAMSAESFKQHIPHDNPKALAIVVGDRSDVHLMALNVNARLMIVTGSRRVDPIVLQAARGRGLSIIRTRLDSATVIRRLKFSCPVETVMQADARAFKPDMRLSDIRHTVLSEHDDVFPVLDAERHLLGVFTKVDFDNASPVKLILVDHNEYDQGILGIEEVPVIEVVDHHRFAMQATASPVKITCDVVGSTSTLIAEMFIANGIEIPRETAGILLGGVITDTLMLHSPTATARDAKIVDLLKTILDIDPDSLLKEIFQVGSVISRSTPEAVLVADCKHFKLADDVPFAVSQVEEVSFEEFYAHKDALLAAAEAFRSQEKLAFFGLLVTNIVRENSIFLAVGKSDYLSKLPYQQLEENLWDLPGVLSRKKQLLPQLLKLSV